MDNKSFLGYCTWFGFGGHLNIMILAPFAPRKNSPFPDPTPGVGCFKLPLPRNMGSSEIIRQYQYFVFEPAIIEGGG